MTAEEKLELLKLQQKARFERYTAKQIKQGKKKTLSLNLNMEIFDKLKQIQAMKGLSMVKTVESLITEGAI